MGKTKSVYETTQLGIIFENNLFDYDQKEA